MGDGAPAARPFPLTLRDIFTNEHTVQVSPETKVFEVKELLRAAKQAEAEAALAAARQCLAQLELEMAREGLRLLALEGKIVAATKEIARLDEQAREAGSLEYVDAMALLFSGQPLDDDSTVGSHELARSTIVMLSMTQDPELGRARRQERSERARAAEEAARREAWAKKARVIACKNLLEALVMGALFGFWIGLCALLCVAVFLGVTYCARSGPAESDVNESYSACAWRDRRALAAGAGAAVAVLLLLLLAADFTAGCGALGCGEHGTCAGSPPACSCDEGYYGSSCDIPVTRGSTGPCCSSWCADRKNSVQGPYGPSCGCPVISCGCDLSCYPHSDYGTCKMECVMFGTSTRSASCDGSC